MPTDVETLCEMGFPQNRAEKAVMRTNYKGVQVAMDWLLAHSDDPDIDEPLPPSAPGKKLGESDTNVTTDGGDAATEQAKSLKCDDCGKQFRSSVEAEAHASRTQHSNFSESSDEIKPLTKEEKDAQMNLLQKKLELRRKERLEREEKEQLEREKARRNQGQDIIKMKQKFQEDELKKIADERKRERDEDRKAKQRIKDLIEADKKARLAAKEGIKNEEKSETVSPKQQIDEIRNSSQQKDYKECRLQIRLTNGNVLTNCFASNECLAAVRVFVEMNRTDGNAPFSFMTTFPKKLFSEEDMEKPLSLLGLVPSAVLVVTKLQSAV